MIYRLSQGQIFYDLSHEAALQVLDNFPPHTQEQFNLIRLTAEDCRQAVETLAAEINRIQVKDTTYYNWVVSRLEMYQRELESFGGI